MKQLLYTLAAVTKSGKLRPAVCELLLGELDAAMDAWGKGNCETASALYQSFIRDIEAHIGKGIAPSAAQSMIVEVQGLIAECRKSARRARSAPVNPASTSW